MQNQRCTVADCEYRSDNTDSFPQPSLEMSLHGPSTVQTGEKRKGPGSPTELGKHHDVPNPQGLVILLNLTNEKKR